ncbi:hypothetical protein [Mesorhizobium sp.]|uniref:hypothetical protein n=1 Tax=Mesorhizobium sp. TaxID=1871066 RepID=UPI0012043BC8|nr:hypothetical protein [Mesorhizobium sp.]TIO26763.1 MAG: hypothetical protein E5X83_05365 [Mesorhizobium sp.]
MFARRRRKPRHNAGNPAFDIVVTYPFHPLVGRTVLVVGAHEHDGIRHLLIQHLHGGTFHFPEWMATPQASSIEVLAEPRLPLKYLLEVRALVDLLVASLRRDSISGGGHADEDPAAHATGFVRPAAPPAEMSEDDRLKAVALLQSLLIEAASVTAPAVRNLKEAGDEQDYR